MLEPLVAAENQRFLYIVTRGTELDLRKRLRVRYYLSGRQGDELNNGAMAQLVARLVRNEKVGGSNPPSSTTDRHPIRMSVFVCPGELSLRRAAGVPGAGGPAVGPGCSVCPWAAARPRAVRAG